MNNKKEVLIDKKIRPHLDEIAERLWTTPSHAAIMVGSGFSKNANIEFPDWEKLGDLFFEKIHGRKPDKDKNEDRYLNPLKLAEEVDAGFGRPVLNKLLNTNIPDNSSNPSPLHIKLLELPWSDVFTTNYDTLLERACDSVSKQKYDIVINKLDLIYSEKPRIIKLHGSFPLKRPIITEEDYRTYPKKFAPFVNTVQQSLLENTLCLVGFSGDDPNFLQWIGWIRDNLGNENSHKIYLVGIYDLSDTQKNLLEKRNIIFINLNKCPGVEGDHYKALERFFDYLLSRKKDDNRLDWPENVTNWSPNNNKEKIVNLEKIGDEWKQFRIRYPDWIIVPEDRREILWEATYKWIDYVKIIDDLPNQIDLKFIFELNWRLEHCLCPIPNSLSNLIEKVLNKYWPFKELAPEQAVILKSCEKYKDFDWKKVQKMWLHLSLSILRFYREEGIINKWDDTYKKINKLSTYLSADERAFLYYEQTLNALFRLDIQKAKSIIDSWPINYSIPFWETKRAGLLAELGYTEKAEKILENSLKKIRKKLNLKPVTNDYSLVSMESTTMLLVQYIKNANAFKNRQFMRQKETQNEFNKRWVTLKQYKCDPWDDIKLFQKELERSPIEKSNISLKRSFDIGSTTQTFRMYSWNQETLISYQFLRFFEESGFPFKIPGSSLGKKSAEGTLIRLAEFAPYWSMATLIRIGDIKAIDRLFNRQALINYNISEIDSLIEKYLNALEKNEPEMSNDNSLITENFGDLIAQIIPEILSRLCSKCSNDKKLLLLDFIRKVYGSAHKNSYRKIFNLVRRLIKTFSLKQQYKIIPKLLEIPYPENTNRITIEEYKNPFLLIDFKKEAIYSKKKLNLNSDKINSLFDLASSESKMKRSWGLMTLIKLYELDLLKKDQEKKLGNILWSKTNNNGFPANTDLYNFVFLKLPHPDKINPYQLFKKYIDSLSFPAQKNGKMRVAITSGNIPAYYEIIGANQYIDWSEKEIMTLLDKLINWWNSDKNYLIESISSSIPFVSTEFEKRFSRLIDIFVKVVLLNLKIESIDKKNQKEIKELISEMNEYGLSTLRVQAAGLHILQLDEDLFIKKINDALVSNDHIKVTDGLQAILIMRKFGSKIKRKNVKKLLISLGHKIRWRHNVGINESLKIARLIVKKYPKNLSGEFEHSCLNGLGQLVIETDLQQRINSLEFDKRLQIRLNAASFAFQLYNFYKQKELEIPNEVLKWKEICSDPEEFAEIKVQWKV